MEIYLIRGGENRLSMGYFHLGCTGCRKLMVSSRSAALSYARDRYVKKDLALKALGMAIAKAKAEAGKDTYAFFTAVLQLPNYGIPPQELLWRLYPGPRPEWKSEWITPVWAAEKWWLDSAAYRVHATHVAEKTPGCIAYKDGAKLIAVKPGKYLAKFFPTLYADEIKLWADKQIQAMKPVEVRFATSKDDCVRVVNLGPRDSCMAAAFNGGDPHWYTGAEHPAAVYATPDIEIAYLEGDLGRVTARAICNAQTKSVARAYGDARLLVPALEKLGYHQRDGALVGCRIARIASDASYYIMAYVDAGIASGGGNLGFRHTSDDNYWVLDSLGNTCYNTYDGYILKGVTLAGNAKPVEHNHDDDHDDDHDEDDEDDEDDDHVTCDSCGDSFREDDTDFVTVGATLRSTAQVCEDCRDEYFTNARIRPGTTRFVRTEDTVFCRSNDRYYHTNYAEEAGVFECVVTNDYYLEGDLVSTSDGFCHTESACELDVPDRRERMWCSPTDHVVCPISGKSVHRWCTFSLREKRDDLNVYMRFWEGIAEIPSFQIRIHQLVDEIYTVTIAVDDKVFTGELDGEVVNEALYCRLIKMAEEVTV